jgi:hypothetical protein
MKAPGSPQRNVQKKTENRTMKGDIDNAFPTNRGSR